MSGVIVRKFSHEICSDKVKLNLLAEIQVGLPEIDQTVAKVPSLERLKCEQAIEFVANVISVQTFTKKSISSISPPVFFCFESEQELSHLKQASQGIDQAPQVYRCHPYSAPDDLQKIVGLIDRREGIDLFAEALSHETASGAYRDLIRLFENAFGKAHSEIGKKLYQFLNPEMGYTRGEVESWLSLRNGVSHGEPSRESRMLMNSDVYWFIPRMEQAALDVLFNKKEWGINSRLRQEVWSPTAFLRSPNDGAVNLGSAAQLDIALVDAYGAFPVKPDSAHICKESFPKSWWPMTPYDRDNGPHWRLTLGKEDANSSEPE